MKWTKVWLIFQREVRDQFRDRRTLFMILVLPIVLYPALGLGLLQMTLQFGKGTRTIGIVGAEDLPREPALLADDGKSFHPSLFKFRDPSILAVTIDDAIQRRDVINRRFDVVIQVPPGASERLDRGEQVKFQVFFDGSDDRSEDARAAVQDLLAKWAERIVVKRMRDNGKPETFSQPIAIDDGQADVSIGTKRAGTAWSRMFPFLLVMMALTGAFYPAIDLCAGEKERGTMETLLISPATRGEIVLGKFLTIFVFSMTTTVVNLASMGMTFAQVSNMLPTAVSPRAAGLLALPSLSSILWMLVLMLPLAAFFSALCMALAVFARSTKEGQYYLMPMFLVVTPLIFLTLAPGVELNPFYSLVPVTNVALLLKSLMLNQYETAAIFFVPVMAPTVLYGFLALRFAAEQFNREDVLFREAERFDLREWLVRLVRDKKPMVTFQQAWAFFLVYMMLRWYLQGRITASPRDSAIFQILTMFTPAVFMALLFTRHPWKSLNLRPPAWLPAVAAVLLAFTIHPLAVALANVLQYAIPMKSPQQIQELLRPLLDAPFWQRFLVLAVVAPICEEVAFRGFLLTGFLRKYRPPLAILVSSVLFGVSHMFPQQMISATLLGVVLGIIATRTGSILPAIAFHALHNGMLATMGNDAMPSDVGNSVSIGYSPILVLMGGLASAILLGLLLRFPSRTRGIPRALRLGTP